MECQVKSIMTETPVFIRLQDTLMQAAQRMKEAGCGFLPVGSPDKIYGVITDRDIVIRAAALGKDVARETVNHHMTHNIYACHENDMVDDAAQSMRKHHVNRLIVKDNAGRISGVLSLGRILREHADKEEIAYALKHAFARSIA